MKLISAMILLAISSSTFASKEDAIVNTIIYNDFSTWLNGGNYLFKWDKIVETKPKLPVTIKKIKNDFQGNEVSANMNYKNKWVRIQGTVKNVKLEKDGQMYADLVENYIEFKAYIPDENFASSLIPNQKIDITCFNSTINYAKQCIDYQNLMWNAAMLKPSVSILKNSHFISNLSSFISSKITDADFKKFCSIDIKSNNCQSFIINEISNHKFDKYFKEICEKKNSSKCLQFKENFKEIELFLN